MDSFNKKIIQNTIDLFTKYDEDKDGKINADQTYGLLKQLGHSTIYKGSVVKALRLLNYSKEVKDLIDHQQFEEFHESFESKWKQQIWKSKYNILEMIQQIANLKKQQKNQGGGGAAPHMVVPEENGGNQFGNISIQIGHSPQYNSSLTFNIQKNKNNHNKPFLKLVFDMANNQSAKKAQKLLDSIWTGLKNLMKQQFSDSHQHIQSIHFNTSINGNQLTLFVTVSIQDLLNLFTLSAEFFDLCLGTCIDASVKLDFKFNYDVMDFLQNQNYSFYDIFTKNCQLKLKWNMMNFMNRLKALTQKANMYSDFEYEATDPFGLTLIALLHSQQCDVQLQFQNTSKQNAELQTKAQLSMVINELRNGIQQACNETNLPIKELIEELTGKITVDLMVSDWKAHAIYDVKNFNQLFLKNIEGYHQGFDSD